MLVTVVLPALASAQDVVTYYQTDAIGSIRATTDAGGQVISRYDFLPSGELWQSAGSGIDVRQFAGSEHDIDTGLDYFGARYYQSQTGRFTRPVSWTPSIPSR
jgi:uncharacterized protein RhaS with RHS repeats